MQGVGRLMRTPHQPLAAVVLCRCGVLWHAVVWGVNAATGLLAGWLAMCVSGVWWEIVAGDNMWGDGGLRCQIDSR